MICCCADGHLTLYFCIADGLVENPLVCSGDFFVVPDMRIRISWTFSNLFFLFSK